MNMKGNDKQMIYKGIDKTKIKGFTVELIDIEKLISNDNVIFQEKLPGIAVEDIKGEIRSINYLKIKDGHIFNTLAIGSKLNKGVPNSYSHIDIHISELTDNNLKPLKVSEYINLLERLKGYLESRYGLYINLEKAKFEELEINVTAKMDKEFIEYEYLLEQMIYLVPKVYEISPYIGKDRTLKQYEFFNGSTEAKVYDKTRQLQEKFKISLDKQYMRIEYTLHKPKKIQSCLGTEYVYQMTDQAIIDYLKKQINKDLIKPIEKHIKEGDKQLLQMAIESKETDSRKWAKSFTGIALAERLDKRNGKLPLVIDLEQVKKAIKKVSTNKSNCNKTLARLQTEFDRYPFINDNLEKLQEIKDKFV